MEETGVPVKITDQI